MKNKKKSFARLLIASIISAFAITGCKQKQNNSRKIGTTSIIELDYGFCNENLITDDSQLTLENELFTKPTHFDVEEKYYLIISCTMLTNTPNGSLVTPIVNMEVSFSDSSYISGDKYTSDAPTEKESIKDPETGVSGFKFTTSTKTANKKNKTLTMKVVVKFLTVKAADSFLSCYITSKTTNLTSENLYFEKFLVVDRVVLETPVIAYDHTRFLLTWKHVNKCEYYCLYIDGNSSAYTYKANNLIVGTIIDWLIDFDELVGTHFVRIQSCHSNNVNFQNSSLSNEVEVIM